MITMKIKELKDLVDKAYENGEECEVEFWIDLDDGSEILAELKEVGQFSFVPDMTITVKPCNEDAKIYTTKIIDQEQFEYRDRYNKLVERLKDIYKEL